MLPFPDNLGDGSGGGGVSSCPLPRRAGENPNHGGHGFVGLLPFRQPCVELCAARRDHGTPLRTNFAFLICKQELARV